MLSLPNNNIHNYTITAVATVFTGAPKLYISAGRICTPNDTTPYTIIFDDIDGGSLPIVSLSLNNLVYTSNNINNNVYIGVGGDNHNSTYSIRAHVVELPSDMNIDIHEDISTDVNHPVLLNLLDGIPQVSYCICIYMYVVCYKLG